MKLMQRWSGHMRLQHGGVKFYEILDGETLIGSKSVFTPRTERIALKHPFKVTYMLGDKTFNTVDEFKAAYAQQRRDDEWDSAAPKGENDDGRQDEN